MPSCAGFIQSRDSAPLAFAFFPRAQGVGGGGGER